MRYPAEHLPIASISLPEIHKLMAGRCGKPRAIYSLFCLWATVSELKFGCLNKISHCEYICIQFDFKNVCMKILFIFNIDFLSVSVDLWSEMSGSLLDPYPNPVSIIEMMGGKQ